MGAINISAPISRKRKQNATLLYIIAASLITVLSILGFLFHQTLSSLQQQKDIGKLRSAAKSPVKDVATAQLLKRQEFPNLRPLEFKKKLVHEGVTAHTEFGGTLVLKTSVGDIKIVLRPDLSPESCHYVHEMVKTKQCSPCNFYRADAPGILQGIMKDERFKHLRKKGSCPPEYADKLPGKCPEWDPLCGCHGPTMKHGMVGWAGGGDGPDFFIDTYKQPAKWWDQQHTVFGQIQDEDSFKRIDEIYAMPTTKNGMMVMLQEPIHFDMEIER